MTTPATAPAMTATRARRILAGQVPTVTAEELQDAFIRVDTALTAHAEKRRRQRAAAAAGGGSYRDSRQPFVLADRPARWRLLPVPGAPERAHTRQLRESEL